MTADLVGSMNNLEHTHEVNHIQKRTFPCPRFNIVDQQVSSGTHSLGVKKTYVYHESIRVTPSLSIPLMHGPPRTMLHFHCVVLSEQSCDSLTGRGERASVERRIAAGHLQDTIGLSK